ncbi:MAG: biopolymer transporter ExbD [Planctomycetales bacterium]|jgi:biopolymer transport protein ExbD|nr:biopolymer transporter ExbD [Planctomycetales bacterium]
MPLKTEALEEPRIDLTSMLDVVMLLMIFFMIGTKFSENERGTDIHVPTVSDTAALTAQPDEIVVNIRRDGTIQVKREPQTPESLKVLLQSAQSGFPNQAVVIRGDGHCEYQQIMDVFSVCKDVGVRNISIAHLPKAGGR